MHHTPVRGVAFLAAVPAGGDSARSRASQWNHNLHRNFAVGTTHNRLFDTLWLVACRGRLHLALLLRVCCCVLCTRTKYYILSSTNWRSSNSGRCYRKMQQAAEGITRRLQSKFVPGFRITAGVNKSVTTVTRLISSNEHGGAGGMVDCYF